MHFQVRTVSFREGPRFSATWPPAAFHTLWYFSNKRERMVPYRELCPARWSWHPRTETNGIAFEARAPESFPVVPVPISDTGRSTVSQRLWWVYPEAHGNSGIFFSQAIVLGIHSRLVSLRRYLWMNFLPRKDMVSTTCYHYTTSEQIRRDENNRLAKTTSPTNEGGSTSWKNCSNVPGKLVYT